MNRVNEYKKEHYDRITLLVKKGDKEYITEKAIENNMSVSAYILSFFPELPSREGDENNPEESVKVSPKKVRSVKETVKKATPEKKRADMPDFLL